MTNDPANIEALVSRVRVYGKHRRAPTAHAAAVYARVSDSRQESLPVQLDMLRGYAGRLGVPIRHEFADEESGLITSRRQYHALLDLARSGQISHVIVFHSSRWGRDDGEYISAARELERLGVEFHATNLGKIDPMMVGMHAMISNMEVRNISAHVLPNMIARARRGTEMGKPRYGYRRTVERGKPEPDPVTFAVVQELFARYVAGESVWELTKWFNGQTGMRKRTFGLSRMLADPYYAGVYIYNRSRNSKIDGAYVKPREEWVVFQHAHPAVTQGVFRAAQERLALNAHIGQERESGPQYALTGLVWCVACEKRMHGQPDRSGKYPFYHCPYCGKGKSVRKVEGLVQQLLAALPIGAQAAGAADQAATRAAQRSASTRPADVAVRVGKLHARRARLTVQYGDGDISRDDYNAALDITDLELQALLTEQETLPAAVTVADVGALVDLLRAIPSWTALFATVTPADANTLYRHCIQACRLDLNAQTATVLYLPAVARVLDRPSDTVSLSPNFSR